MSWGLVSAAWLLAEEDACRENVVILDNGYVAMSIQGVVSRE